MFNDPIQASAWEFYRNRRQNLMNQDPNFGFPDNSPKTILQIIPHEKLGDQYRLNDLAEISKIANSHFLMNDSQYSYSYPETYSIHGLQIRQEASVSRYGRLQDNQLRKIISIFRDGVIEQIAPAVVFSENSEPCIHGGAFERDLGRSLGTYLTILEELGFSAPIQISLSLVVETNYSLLFETLLSGVIDQSTRAISNPVSRRNKTHLFFTEPLDFPPLIIRKNDEVKSAIDQPFSTLRPLFNILWQICGLNKSPHFTEKGQWNYYEGIKDE